MKIAIYIPDNWNEFAIKLRLSMMSGSDQGQVWFEVSEPREHHPEQVEIILEDDE